MIDIANPTEVASASLQLLRSASANKLSTFCSDSHNLFMQHLSLSKGREHLHEMVEEFRAFLNPNLPEFNLEFGFLYEWSSCQQLIYDARWWINEYPFGVYFIFDKNSILKYVGSACGGALGNRIWNKRHEGFRHSVDIVLFPRPIGHFALALEPFVISKLVQRRFADVELTNKQFVDLQF